MCPFESAKFPGPKKSTRQVEKKAGIPVAEQLLLHQGTLLQDATLMGACGLVSSEITLLDKRDAPEEAATAGV